MNNEKIISEILNLLRNNGKTIATAESITAGHVQSMLASVSGASDVFKGGITAYKQSVKTDVLAVNTTLATQTDCVDPEIARQMAKGALNLFNSDIAVATCGYAEPCPKQQIYQPFAYLVVAERGEGTSSVIREEKRVNLSGSRSEAQKLAASIAISMLRDTLKTDQ